MRIAVAVMLLLALGARADEPPVVAAKARQARVKTLTALVRQTSLIPAGGYSRAKPHLYKGKPHAPASDLTHWAVNRLMLSGDLTLWEDHVRAWHPTDPPMNRRVHIWDGTKGLTFLPDGFHTGRAGPLAVYSDDFKILPHEMPLLVTFRPLDKNAQPWVKFDRLEATGRTELVDGEACVEHEAGVGTSEAYRLLLSPRREYLPVLIQRVIKGKLGASTTIAYRQYAKGAWAPVRWVTERPGDDGVATRTAEVLSLRINEPLPASVLTPVFRPGTSVHDYVKGAQTEYVVQPDGSWRLIAAPAAELPWWRQVSATGWGVALVVVILTILAALLLSRITPRSSPPR